MGGGEEPAKYVTPDLNYDYCTNISKREQDKNGQDNVPGKRDGGRGGLFGTWYGLYVYVPRDVRERYRQQQSSLSAYGLCILPFQHRSRGTNLSRFSRG